MRPRLPYFCAGKRHQGDWTVCIARGGSAVDGAWTRTCDVWRWARLFANKQASNRERAREVEELGLNVPCQSLLPISGPFCLARSMCNRASASCTHSCVTFDVKVIWMVTIVLWYARPHRLSLLLRQCHALCLPRAVEGWQQAGRS